MLTFALAAFALAPALTAPVAREEKAGWIVIHLAGKPYDVGLQHGTLLSKEIEDAIQTAVASGVAHGNPDWEWLRQAAVNICWPKTPPEYQQEIKGIAAGLQAKGIQRDWKDVLALNAHIELWKYYAPVAQAARTGMAAVSQAPLSCSAFVATGSETRDGRPVIGHNFWWDYILGPKWRVVVDIQPEHGHRVMYDALPGLIHSGTDWSINDAGIAISETTISGFTGFDTKGIPEFVRMREAAQYSESLDDAYRYFVIGNNGGYANAWLMTDVKTGEIGKLELGLKNVIFHRTTDGYYVGSNFAEDPKLNAQEAAAYRAGPEENCTMRKARWKEHLDADKGMVDVETGKSYLGDSFNERTQKQDGQGSALCGKNGFGGALNAKIADASMIEKLSFWARYGVPDGSDLDLSQVTRVLPNLKNLLYPTKGHDWVVIGK